MQPTTPDPLTYACRYEDQLVVKRLIRDAGTWWLVSDSPDQRRYPRREAGPAVEVIGRVVYRQSERL
jgi:phage repressor protein C with HTH and peptisase S24 domain